MNGQILNPNTNPVHHLIPWALVDRTAQAYNDVISKKLAKSGWHPSDIDLNGFNFPKFLPNGKPFHVEAGAGHDKYTEKVFYKVAEIIDNTPINQLEGEMYNFAQVLRNHIEDAYIAGKSLDDYFKSPQLVL